MYSMLSLRIYHTRVLLWLGWSGYIHELKAVENFCMWAKDHATSGTSEITSGIKDIVISGIYLPITPRKHP